MAEIEVLEYPTTTCLSALCARVLWLGALPLTSISAICQPLVTLAAFATANKHSPDTACFLNRLPAARLTDV